MHNDDVSAFIGWAVLIIAVAAVFAAVAFAEMLP